MGWACSGEEVWERCGKCWLPSAQICKKTPKPPNPTWCCIKGLNPDGGDGFVCGYGKQLLGVMPKVVCPDGWMVVGPESRTKS